MSCMTGKMIYFLRGKYFASVLLKCSMSFFLTVQILTSGLAKQMKRERVRLETEIHQAAEKAVHAVQKWYLTFILYLNITCCHEIVLFWEFVLSIYMKQVCAHRAFFFFNYLISWNSNDSNSCFTALWRKAVQQQLFSCLSFLWQQEGCAVESADKTKGPIFHQPSTVVWCRGEDQGSGDCYAEG